MIEPTSSRTNRRGYQAVGTGPTVACPICGALFTPAPRHQELWQAPTRVLESALMSMSHFCFRCRRPACPECWDPVNGVCGACVDETGLSFRAEAPPLEGTAFPPARTPQPQPRQEADSLLSCVRAGRFRAAAPPSHFITAIETVETGVVQPIGKLLEEKRVVEEGKRRSWGTLDVEDVPTVPPVIEEEDEQEARHEERGLLKIEEVPTVPPGTEEEDELPREKISYEVPLKPTRHMRPQRPAQAEKRRSRRAGRVGHSLTIVTLVILLVLLLLILVAEFSPDANALIVQVVHIDVRAEIEYLLHLAQLFH